VRVNPAAAGEEAAVHARRSGFSWLRAAATAYQSRQARAVSGGVETDWEARASPLVAEEALVVAAAMRARLRALRRRRPRRG
jgi:hypothetical protein